MIKQSQSKRSALSPAVAHLVLVRPMRAFFAHLAFIGFVCSSAVAVADTVQRGDSTITFSPPPARDSAPMPVGGVAAFASKLYYPPGLRTRPYIVHGNAMVSVTVEPNGRVTDISFSPRMHAELERVVIQALRSCHWKPAQKHNVPVRGWLRFPVRFDTYKK
jgi:TonB family protein